MSSGVSRVVVPAPDFLVVKAQKKYASPSPNKISTVLTNVQRRNVQTLAPSACRDLTVFQMAAQGELIMLQSKLGTPGFFVDTQDANGFTPYLWACANGQKAAVELLLYHGADPMLTGDNGENGLLLAASRGHYDVALYLLRAGIPVDVSDELCNTALMFATSANHIAIVSLLLEWGADLTLQNAEGWTAYDFAVKRGSRASQRVIEKHIINILQGKP
ncbi:unnamed protein product [Protopolystoma xenopodis]|uniref:Uncharacterized protein n=1 Tax=Protopolystoma xenopodis TaxID=117903 RepID=A0A3S5BPY7_9PLAT|nr:unnamed protein product [Protopolystoma xenopodis]